MADEPRQGRKEEVAAQRRRRGNSEMRADARLPIPEDVAAQLKAKGLVPRWVNDTGNRIYRLTEQDDYDRVEGVEPVPVGNDPFTGKPMLAHLLAKRADFIAEDRAERAKVRDNTEQSLLRGEVPGGADPDNPRPAGPSPTYVANGTNISRGNQILE
jgi:hypothetical protein